MKRALIIGGGFGGCTAAHQLEKLGHWSVDLVEAAPFLGGGCKTFYMGGHPYTFGPRHFLTEMEHTYEYLNGIVPLRRCAEHKFWTYVEPDQNFYHYPINMQDISRMPDAEEVITEMGIAPGPKGAKNLEEYWLKSVGQRLYSKFIDDYNKKMWMVDDNTKIDHNVENWTTKGPTIKDGPCEVFDDCISAYPFARNGYDDFFDVATEEANVMLNTKAESIDLEAKTAVIHGVKQQYDVIISTICVDDLFDRCYGELKFIGREFYPIVLPSAEVFPEGVYFCYYAGPESVTRVVEYKKLTQHESPTTLIGVEVPSLGRRLYPVPFKSEVAKAQRYLDELPDDVFSIGRNGRYDYVRDVDDVIDDAMQVAKDLSTRVAA